MAYTKQNWVDGPEGGTPLSAARLNHIEAGIQNEQVGPKGDKGDTGDAGPKGDKGDKGDTGAAGADAPTIVDITSDGTEITFTLSDDTSYSVAWPAQ